jgi:ubiquinone/menaquinone biosynthesis C-methylase UbiE
MEERRLERKKMNPNENSPQFQMIQMISGFWVSRAVHMAATLGLADHLKERPLDASELAEATGTHAPSLYRLMRALASTGLLVEDEDKRFALTPLGATLQSNVPGSLRAFAMSELGGVHYPSWGEALYSIKTGEIAFDHVFGMSCWEYFAKHPEQAQIFNQSMSDLTALVEAAVLESYDFSAFGKIIDVGGGHASLITSILKKYPQAKGVLFDAPQVVEGARERIEAHGLAERCEVVGGDFFKSVPAGGDAYIMKHIIHDWDDKQAIEILKRIRHATKEDGKLLLVEQVILPGNEPQLGKFSDLIMMIMVGGRERTEEEYGALFAAAGFRLTNITGTQSPVSIIEGVPA